MQDLLIYNRRVILYVTITAVLLFLAAFALDSGSWVRYGMLFFGTSFLSCSGWIYFRKYRPLKRKIKDYARFMKVGRPKAGAPVKLFLYLIWRICGNLYFLSFINGLCLAFAIFANLQDQYENHFFETLSAEVAGKNKSVSEDSLFIRASHICHMMLAARSATFSKNTKTSWVDRYIRPLSSDLITADGACGSYSLVLCRILQELKYDVRLAQMKGENNQTCHVLVEVRSSHGWVILDPLYDLYFLKPNGYLASFSDVSADWKYYRPQLPAQYDPRYCYKGVVYTNWNKIPVLLPALRSILSCFMDNDSLRHISLRTYFLRKYRVLEDIVLVILLLPFSTLIVKIIRKRHVSLFPVRKYKRTEYPPLFIGEMDWTKIRVN